MAKKISILARDAFYAGKNFKRSNTEVYNDNGVIELYLYGNLIAKKLKDVLLISTAGWDTTTTKERLNVLDGVHVSIKKGILYLNGKEWNGDWINIETA